MGDTEKEYGPFHRVRSSTQTDKVAIAMQESGELWGKIPRGGMEPVVQAFAGPLGDKVGVEFYSSVEPYRDTPPSIAEWRPGYEGVRVEGEFAKIPIRVVCNSQVGK